MKVGHVVVRFCAPAPAERGVAKHCQHGAAVGLAGYQAGNPTACDPSGATGTVSISDVPRMVASSMSIS
jgi:hypothetical protein